MPIEIALVAILALFAVAVLGIATHRGAAGRMIVYGLASLTSIALLAVGLVMLLGARTVSATVLPLGLPWLGAHFRIELPAAAGELITAVPRQEVVIPDVVPSRRRWEP